MPKIFTWHDICAIAFFAKQANFSSKSARNGFMLLYHINNVKILRVF